MVMPIAANALGYDRALAAMFFGAKAGETVSLRAALADQAGERWGCWMCRLLHIVVERDHCPIQLQTNAGPQPFWVGVRAAALMLFGALLPTTLLCWAAWEVVL